MTDLLALLPEGAEAKLRAKAGDYPTRSDYVRALILDAAAVNGNSIFVARDAAIFLVLLIEQAREVAALRELRKTVAERVREWTQAAENPGDPDAWRTFSASRDEAVAILAEIDRMVGEGA